MFSEKDHEKRCKNLAADGDPDDIVEHAQLRDPEETKEKREQHTASSLCDL
ncbi:MAG: hypothetical protein IJ055_08900 [Oscillospiraceae bacterium]|nr:hypothetical protein [Oscillospiraceae bacterium]